VRILAQFYKKFAFAQELGSVLMRTLRESVFLIYVAISLFLLIALITFNQADPGWSHTGSSRVTGNAAGEVGAWLADLSLSLFGITSYLFPFLLSGYGYSIYRGRTLLEPTGGVNFFLRWIGFGAAITAGSALADIHLPRPPVSLPETSGGVLGQEAANLLADSFGIAGTSVLLTSIFLAGVSLYTSLSWLGVLDSVGKAGLIAMDSCLVLFKFALGKRPDRAMASNGRTEISKIPERSPVKKTEPTLIKNPQRSDNAAKSAGSETTNSNGKSRKIVAKANPPSVASIPLTHVGQLPPLKLLNDVAPKIKGYSKEILESMSEQVEMILADFGVQVQVTEVHPGPVITRFEIQPAPGVKVSRISSLAKDLARALSVTSVRVVEIIPGKSVVGLEIPNEERETVLLHSVLSSEVYQHSSSTLTIVLGKDISGLPVVANLARMPHLLVAGTTGSGKSVAINVMILSLLYKAQADQVRLIMIDPKMLELSVYEGIPHLLTPVVTDMKEAANALRWCVAEMDRRYKLMSLLGVRNLAGYNQKISEAAEAGNPIHDPLWSSEQALEGGEPPLLAPLPFIVIVIDELADMMMIVGKKVEELIARLAQKARAAGLHLILATQRPSVDVLTGLIKANIPTRIAFQVSSRIDSRTIIDQGGAEALLGNGDMLYLPPGTGLPMRAHGAFVSDQDVHKIVEFLKSTGRPNYIEEIVRFTEDSAEFGGSKSSGGGEAVEEADPLYDEAVRFVLESRKASISSVQRRFKVGYNRAARMIEDMEKAGLVGPAETNGSREILAPAPEA
jgi:S-DNA-T family DNA segregation ATPase FtsK/SpoIIIE